MAARLITPIETSAENAVWAIPVILIMLLSCGGPSSRNERAFGTDSPEVSIAKSVFDTRTAATLRMDGPYGDWPVASEFALDSIDLSYISCTELRMISSEILARHGYVFEDGELRDHFFETHWYDPRFSNVDSLLSDVERSNIVLLRTAGHYCKDYTEDEQLEVFKKSVGRNHIWQHPHRLLSHKLGETVFPPMRVIRKADMIVFPAASRRTFIRFSSHSPVDGSYDVLRSENVVLRVFIEGLIVEEFEFSAFADFIQISDDTVKVTEYSDDAFWTKWIVIDEKESVTIEDSEQFFREEAEELVGRFYRWYLDSIHGTRDTRYLAPGYIKSPEGIYELNFAPLDSQLNKLPYFSTGYRKRIMDELVKCNGKIRQRRWAELPDSQYDIAECAGLWSDRWVGGNGEMIDGFKIVSSNRIHRRFYITVEIMMDGKPFVNAEVSVGLDEDQLRIEGIELLWDGDN